VEESYFQDINFQEVLLALYATGLSDWLVRRRASVGEEKPYPLLHLGDLDMVVKGITRG